VVITFDESGSMGKGMRRCAQAMQQFLKGSSESDEFALIGFADHVVLEHDFTNDTGTIQDLLMQARSHGNTALLDAVRSAASRVTRAHNQRRVILVVSDGGDNRSRLRTTEARRILLEAGAQLYAVSIQQNDNGANSNTANGSELLDELCGITGGRNIPLGALRDLSGAMTKINAEIRSEYTLAYRPQHLECNRKFHPANRAAVGRQVPLCIVEARLLRTHWPVRRRIPGATRKSVLNALD
jgi:Ca-activated chloride channel homolog